MRGVEGVWGGKRGQRACDPGHLHKQDFQCAVWGLWGRNVCWWVASLFAWALIVTCLCACRAFAEVLAALQGDKGRVVAVTSAEKAKAVLDSRPNFWEITKVL